MCNLLLGGVTDVLSTFYQYVSCNAQQHGPPLLGRVQLPRCSPTSILCRPQTPCPHQPLLRFLWPVASLDAGARAVPGGRQHMLLLTCRVSETTHQLSTKPGCVEERQGQPRYLGLMAHGPHARAPTLRRHHRCDRRKVRYRLRQAHPSPDGLYTRWTTHKISCWHRHLQSHLTNLAW